MDFWCRILADPPTLVNIILTVVIAGAAIAQAIFARKLWQLQKFIEDQRARTFVSAVLEYMVGLQSQPGNAFLRLENASGIGVMVKRVHLAVTAKGKESRDLNLNLAVGPYSSRGTDITNDLQNTVWDANPGAPPSNENHHSAEIEVTAEYDAEENTRQSPTLKFRATYSRFNLQRIELI